MPATAVRKRRAAHQMQGEALMRKTLLPSIALKSAGVVIGALILVGFMWAVSA
jgi:hypothetical protein